MKLPFKTFFLCIVGAVALAAPANNGYAAPAHGQGWPLILCQPESQMVPDGAKVMFCVRAEGEPPNESIGLAYQWQTNMNFDLDHPDKGWIDIANATLA